MKFPFKIVRRKNWDRSLKAEMRVEHMKGVYFTAIIRSYENDRRTERTMFDLSFEQLWLTTQMSVSSVSLFSIPGLEFPTGIALENGKFFDIMLTDIHEYRL